MDVKQYLDQIPNQKCAPSMMAASSTMLQLSQITEEKNFQKDGELSKKMKYEHTHNLANTFCIEFNN